MLRSIEDLEGYAISATDGAIGNVKDLYFDDRAWVVRYLVVETGAWLSSRKVLISPIAIGRPDRAQRLLSVRMTKEQVRNSPAIDTDKPVSRQHEMEFSSYHGYPYYWGGAGAWGGGLYPNQMMPGTGGYGSPQAIRSEEQAAYARAEEESNRTQDPHLRSCDAVMKYHVHASDGDMGHVDGMLIDEETWAVRYLIINTSNWWQGHQVLVAPDWIDDVSWRDSKVSVKLTRRAIQDAPAYEPSSTLDRAAEKRLYGHYGQAGYWSENPPMDGPVLRGDAKSPRQQLQVAPGTPPPPARARTDVAVVRIVVKDHASTKDAAIRRIVESESIADLEKRVRVAEKERDSLATFSQEERYLRACSRVVALERELDEKLVDPAHRGPPHEARS